jgi:hypothetical protein
MKMPESIHLRKFPYPFSAGLAIASDLDNLHWEDFLEIRKFLNTDLDTSMGRGLRMEIGETFWCYSLLPYEVTYFEGLTGKQSPYAPQLREMIKAGFIDSFHSYGDFNRWEKPENPVYFNRKLAETAIEEFSKHDIKFDTYINHGDPFNIQNFKAQLADNRGDIPGQDAYHADLTVDRLGIRFYWSCDLTAVVGQDRKIRLDDHRYHRFKTEHFVKGIAKSILGLSQRKRKVYGNELLRPIELRDGRRLLEFPRYCYSYRYIYTPPGRDVLTNQLSDKVLDRLEKLSGYMVIYTHFGQPLQRTTATIFGTDLVRRWQALKLRSADGRLWVTTTTRLLKYNYTHKYLKWRYSVKEDGRTAIEIDGPNGPVDINPDYEGLTFYCDTPEKTLIYIDGTPVENTIANAPDKTGRKSISIPIRSLEFPVDIF